MKITLQAARVNARMTQADAAKAIGVTEKTIGKWENGTTFPDVDKAMRLCSLYGVKLDNVSFLPQELG